jgi:hypothetical protein
VRISRWRASLLQKLTWREARPDDPMFGKIFIVPIRALFAEADPGLLGETEDRPHCDDGQAESP